jgi:hypothetical protein
MEVGLELTTTQNNSVAPQRMKSTLATEPGGVNQPEGRLHTGQETLRSKKRDTTSSHPVKERSAEEGRQQ